MPKSKAEKKKERERKSRKIVLKRREELRKKSKEEKEAWRETRKADAAKNTLTGRTHKRKNEAETLSQLEHNLSILEALEQEYEQVDKARAEAQRDQKGLNAAADVSFTPNT